MNMKILVTHYGLYKKNGWGRTFEEAKCLSKLGHQVVLLCSDRRQGCFYKKYQVEGVFIYAFYDIVPLRRLSSGYGFLSVLFKSVYSIFHRFDICLSNSHRDNAYFPCAVNRFFHHSKLIVEWWDDFSEKNKKIISPKFHTRLKMRRNEKQEIATKLSSDAVVVLSQTMALRAQRVGVLPDKIRVVRGGCDIDHIIYKPISDVTRKSKYAIPSDCITFGFIGDGDAEIDDIGVFLDALNELKSKFKVMFLNYGRPLKKTVIDRPELNDIIHECGWVNYYGDNSILAATDVFVLIKQDNVENQSGWPNKFGDYLACGRAVMVNPYGEIIPFIKEWNPGVIQVEYSKESIKSGITAICERAINIEDFGDRNYSIAKSNSWLNKAKELEEVMNDLTKQK